jgi:hypothetical protein
MSVVKIASRRPSTSKFSSFLAAAAALPLHFKARASPAAAVARISTLPIAMRIFFHSDQLKHNPKHEILGGRVVDYMETPSRALSVLAACSCCRGDGSALGPVTEPDDNGLQHILAVHSEAFIEHSKTRNAPQHRAHIAPERPLSPPPISPLTRACSVRSMGVRRRQSRWSSAGMLARPLLPEVLAVSRRKDRG